MKRKPLFLLLVAWGCLVLPLIPAGVKTNETAYNVLLITLDTTRADHIGVYGKHRQLTPNIDRLAGLGSVFTRAFSHTPMTLPAHANILTGSTPLYHGIGDNTGFRLDQRFLTLAEWLRPRGYATAAFVSSFVLDRTFGLDQGFDLYREPIGQDSFLAAEVVPLAHEWIASQKDKWFCWLHLWDPHFPYAPPAPFDERYSKNPYAGEIAYMDAELGKLFSFLENSKRLESTLLIITGDHGESLGEHGEFEHGFFAYNSTVHIPLIICLPGARHRTVQTLVSHVDIFPTVCDILGGAPPPRLAGMSLLPMLNGGTEVERPVYIESKGPFLTRGWAPLEGFIDGKVKYIDQPIKELYDMEKDFQEGRNIISTRKLVDLNRELADLKKKMAGTDTAAARMTMSAETLRRLRSFGYLAGIKVEKKAAFSRDDDLKTLLPIQNKLRTANQLFNMRKYREAREIYGQVIASKPDDIGPYIHLADTLYYLRQPQAAVDILRQGLQRKPDSRELKSKLGVFLTEINRNDEAVVLLKEILANDPADSANWNYLGVAFFRMKNFSKANEAYEKALALDPENAQAYANLGALHLARYVATKDETRREEAVAAFNRAIELDAKLISAYNGRGAASKFAGQVEAALTDWRKVLELKPDFTDAYFNIAVTLIAAGRKAEASDTLQRLQLQFPQLISVRDRETLQRLLAEAGGQ
jgi:arylsulfatase A-like enzyme/Flp pilus assembly protein TadD